MQTTPAYAGLLAAHWQARDLEEGERPLADERATLRHSMAGSCSRKIWYWAKGYKGAPFDLGSTWITTIGELVHEQWQKVMLDKYGDDAHAEVPCFIPICLSAGSTDLVLYLDGQTRKGKPATYTVVFELKSINGTGFRFAAKDHHPRESALIQGALNAWANDADELRVGYLSLENTSIRNAKGLGLEDIDRFCIEFVYTPAEFNPIAEAEIERFCGILNDLETDTPSPREIPRVENEQWVGVQVVTDPKRGKVRDGARATTWQCDYCAYRERCVEDWEQGD